MKEDEACDQRSDKRTLCAEARFWPLMRRLAESGRTPLQQGTVARAVEGTESSLPDLHLPLPSETGSRAFDHRWALNLPVVCPNIFKVPQVESRYDKGCGLDMRSCFVVPA